jgi:glycosyltransferase involved in cell wall biosynthesis
MHNLHISLTEFRNESRVLKETGSLLKHGLFEKVTIVALHAEALAERENLGSNCELVRLRIRSRGLPARPSLQLIKFAEFCIRVIGLALREHPDVVNVHALALLPLGVIVKLFSGARLVYDAHELESEVEGLRGLRQVLSRWVERICLPAVDLTITVGPLIRDWYRDRYRIANVVAVLNCPPFAIVERRKRLRDELGIAPHQAIYLYQGALCAGRGIELLLESFENSDGGSAVLVCMGYGELAEDIIRASARCPRIFYFPAVPPSRVLEYTVSADVGFVLTGIDDPQCLNNQFCLPNKLFEYGMAGVPMICSPMREMTTLMTEYGIGVVIDAATPAAVGRAVRGIHGLQRDALRQRLVEFARRFCWEEQERVMIDAYQQHVFRRD